MGSGTELNMYIKDGIARLVVEMVKREWLNFLQELTAFAQPEKGYQIEVNQL
jgi:hypothetical protein